MRVFVISDIHADYRVNYDWAMGLSRSEYRDDVLLVCGDIADKQHLLIDILSHFQDCFAMVGYVPGNHDLWVQADPAADSFDRFTTLMALCAELGVQTGITDYAGIRFVALEGWYDYSFGQPSTVLKRSWRDYQHCDWNGYNDNAVTEHFLNVNRQRLNDQLAWKDTDIVISYSHFLPRLDVMPDYIPQRFRHVYPVLGSEQIDKQVREVGSTLHLYGHSHVNRDLVIDGVRYVNNAFGNPQETRIAAKSLKCVYEQ